MLQVRSRKRIEITGVGAEVSSLSSHENQRVSNLARRLIGRWSSLPGTDRTSMPKESKASLFSHLDQGRYM